MAYNMKPGQERAMGVLQKRADAGTIKERGQARLDSLRKQQAGNPVPTNMAKPPGTPVAQPMPRPIGSQGGMQPMPRPTPPTSFPGNGAQPMPRPMGTPGGDMVHTMPYGEPQTGGGLTMQQPQMSQGLQNPYAGQHTMQMDYGPGQSPMQNLQGYMPQQMGGMGQQNPFQSFFGPQQMIPRR